jgi:hypothetical protein
MTPTNSFLIHKAPQTQSEVIVIADEIDTKEAIKLMPKEGEFLGSVLYHTLPIGTLAAMLAFILRMAEKEHQDILDRVEEILFEEK